MLEGKKLLVLGGKPIATYDIVKYAKSKGVYTIVTDFLPIEKSRAKQIADECWDISTAEVNILTELVKRHKIDGVFAGVHEFNIAKTMEICEKTGLPFYASREQMDFATNKDIFKKTCRSYKVPVVEEFNLDSTFKAKDIDSIEYPVIVKPVDNSGGRGIFICNTKKELKENYLKAMSFSSSKHVIVERYMTSQEVVIYYTFQDGYISLSAMCDRYTNRSQYGVAQVQTAFIYPSKHLKLYQSTLDKDVRRMFEGIGIKNGVAFIQSFIENERFYFYEIGFRLNAAQEFRFISRINGINTLEMMVNYALTGQMSGWDVRKFDKPNINKWCCNLAPIARTGKIGQIIGLDEVAKFPEVVDIVPVNYEGDTIEPEHIGTLHQIIARIFIISSHRQTLQDIIDRIYEKIKVLSVEGENMLLEGFDTKLLNYYN